MNLDDIIRLDWSRVFPTAIRLGLSAAQTTLECCYSTGVWICIGRSCSGRIWWYLLHFGAIIYPMLLETLILYHVHLPRLSCHDSCRMFTYMALYSYAINPIIWNHDILSDSMHFMCYVHTWLCSWCSNQVWVTGWGTSWEYWDHYLIQSLACWSLSWWHPPLKSCPTLQQPHSSSQCLGTL